MTLRGWTWLAAIVLCIAAWAGLVVAVRAHNENMREEGRLEVRASWKAAVDREQAHQDAIEADRRKKQEIADAERSQALAAAAAERARLGDAGVRADRRIAQLVAAARDKKCPSQPADGQRPGEQGSDPLDLLAQLYSRADTEAGELGQYADALRTAGERCERSHDIEVTP